MKILIVDDHPILRLGVRQLIAQAWPGALIAEAESAAEAAAELARAPADAVVLDLSLPDARGAEAPALLLRCARGAPILVLSLNAGADFIARLLEMGIVGYVSKDRAADELVLALRAALEGRARVPIELPEAAAAAPHEHLSAQEFRVMQLIASGRSGAQIAEEMRLSIKSVGSYRARVLAKAGWANTHELKRYCMQRGLAAPLTSPESRSSDRPEPPSPNSAASLR